MGKRSSTIIIGLLLVVILCLIALLFVMLPMGNNNMNPAGNNNQSDNVNGEDGDPSAVTDYDQVVSYFATMDGYWTSGSQFVAFLKLDGKYYIEYGLYETSFWESGVMQEASVSGTNAFSITIVIPARPKTDMDDARPEVIEIVYLDVSNLADKKLNIKIKSFGDDWHTYEYGGKSIEEAFSY